LRGKNAGVEKKVWGGGGGGGGGGKNPAGDQEAKKGHGSKAEYMENPETTGEEVRIVPQWGHKTP